MKTLCFFITLAIASLASVKAQAITNTMCIFLVHQGPDYVQVCAEQFANHRVEIQASGEPTFAAPMTFASWNCYPYDQTVSGSFPVGFYPTLFSGQ